MYSGEQALNGETHKLVGQQLIEAGLITEVQLREALMVQKENGGFLGKILIDMKLVSEEDLAAFLQRQCRVPHVTLANMNVPEEATRSIPKELAYRFRLIAIDKLGKVLSIGMVNPMDQDAIDIIKETTGLSVRPFICTNSDLDMKLRDQYGPMDSSEDAQLLPTSGSVEEVLDETPEAAANIPVEEEIQKEEEIEDQGDGLLVPDYTFETFVVGNGNDFTHAIARAVAENPGVSHNPVYIHGQCGLGKTHLLHAIGNEIKKRTGSAKISYRSLEEFVSEMIEAIQMGRVDDFRQYYVNRDCLLLDDIQFLAGKERAQEEFVNTFERIYEAHRQIVITSDRPPKEIRALKESLRNRFEGGIITDIRAPDEETRQAILRSIARRYGIEISTDVLSMIAGCIDTNVRELEGCLKKLIAFSSITDQPITVDLAKGVLRKFGKVLEQERTAPEVSEPEPSKNEIPGKASEMPEKKIEPKADVAKSIPLRKEFGDRLKSQLQKSKKPEEVQAILKNILAEAQKLFRKKGDQEFVVVLEEAVDMAESGDIKNAIILIAKACKG